MPIRVRNRSLTTLNFGSLRSHVVQPLPACYNSVKHFTRNKYFVYACVKVGITNSNPLFSSSSSSPWSPEMHHQQPGREVSLSWLPVYPNNPPPPNAIEAQPGMFVIRGRERSDVIPGKWLARSGGAGYIPFDGREKIVNSFEVLCNTSLYQTAPA